jgi:hypothetical protein
MTRHRLRHHRGLPGGHAWILFGRTGPFDISIILVITFAAMKTHVIDAASKGPA